MPTWNPTTQSYNTVLAVPDTAGDIADRAVVVSRRNSSRILFGSEFDPFAVRGSTIIPGGNSVLYVGDSITNGVSPVYRANDSYRTWASLLAGNVVTYAGLLGNAGWTAEQVRDTFVPQILAMNPKPTIVSVLIGTNNATANNPTATFAVIRDGIYAPLQAAGITVIANSLTPRSDAVPFVTTLTQLIAQHAARTGMPYCNHMTTALTDPATGGIRASLANDAIHPNAAGHKIMGEALATVLKSVARPWTPPLAVSDADTTSLFSRPTFSAGFTDANADSLPDGIGSPTRIGLAFTSGAADTTVSYVDATPDGVAGRWLTLTRTGTTAALGIAGHGTAPTVTVGDRIAFGLALKVENAQADTSITVRLTGSQSANQSIDTAMIAIGPTWKVNIGPVFYYAESVIPVGFVAPGIRFNVDMTGAAGAILRLGQVTFRNLTALGIA